jgi:hypothetical protein
MLALGLFLLWRVLRAVSRGEGFERAEIPEAFQALPITSDPQA